MGLGPSRTEQVLSWVTVHQFPAGSGIRSPSTGRAAAQMGAMLGVKVVLLGSNRECEEIRNTEQNTTLLTFCDSKLI